MAFYNPHPPESKGEIPHDDGWTTSIEGYIYEAKKLSTVLIRNPKASWFVTIYIHPVLTAAQHKAMFARATRVLRKRITAFWIREILPSDKLHYHFLIREEVSKSAVASIFEAAMPTRKILKWHKKILPVLTRGDHNRISRYITKAKVTGKVRGRVVSDKYRNKRHLFLPRSGLNKHGTVGSYWRVKPSDVWKGVVENARWLDHICGVMGMAVVEVKYALSHARTRQHEITRP